MTVIFADKRIKDSIKQCFYWNKMKLLPLTRLERVCNGPNSKKTSASLKITVATMLSCELIRKFWQDYVKKTYRSEK